jgi:hypothetical protein
VPFLSICFFFVFDFFFLPLSHTSPKKSIAHHHTRTHVHVKIP